jgi:hypothetical protein
MRIPGTSLEVALRSSPAPPAPAAEPEVLDAREDYASGQIGLEELALRVERALAEKDPSAGAVGKDGTGSWFNDAMAGGWDTNPELAGRLKYEIYREMRLTDPAVRSLEWMFKLPIRSAAWAITPARNDPDGEDEAARRAEFAEKQFGLGRYFGDGRLDLSWDALNQQDLLYLSYGAQGGELVWADEPEDFVAADGTVYVGKRFLARIAPRVAASVSEIEVDEKTGALTRVRQDIPGLRGDGWIPGDKMIWLVNEQEGGNRWGQSLLRAVYGPWRIKKALMLSAAIGWDRWSVGIPIVRHPPGKKAEAQEMGRNVRVHERAWVTLEGPPPEQGGDWGLDLLRGTGAISDPTPLLRYYDQQIAVAGLQQFSSLGTTERGSRAVGEVLADPYFLAVQAIADYLREERMRRVLRRLWDVNFGAHVPTPEITVSKIQGRNVAVLARALADLSVAGLSFADRDTQNDVRDLLDLRHLPELEEVPEAGIAPVPPPAPPGAVPEEGGSIIPAAV